MGSVFDKRDEEVGKEQDYVVVGSSPAYDDAVHGIVVAKNEGKTGKVVDEGTGVGELDCHVVPLVCDTCFAEIEELGVAGGSVREDLGFGALDFVFVIVDLVDDD